MKIIRVASTLAVLLLFGSTMPVYAQHEGGEKQEERQARPQEQHAQQPAPQPRAAQPKPQVQPRAAQPKAQAEPRQAEQRRAQQSQPRAEQAQHAQPARQQEQHAAVQQRSQLPQQQPRAQQAQQDRQQTQPQRTQQQARTWQQQKGWAQGGGSQGHATFAQDRSQNWSSDHRTWSQRGGYGGYYIPQSQFSVSFGSQHFFRLGGLPVMYMGYPRFAYGGFSFLMVDPWPGDWSANWYASDDVYIDYDDGYYLFNRRYPQERLAISIQL
jgi:hypothetical protein